jgi:hypothetical protein
MNLRYCTLVLAFAAVLVGQDKSETVRFGCDLRVEFLTALARAAGFPEFAQKGDAAPYQRAVDAWLAPHRGHEALQRLVAMRREHGTSYDALPSLALHLTPPPAFAELADFETAPERLDARWKLAPTRAFLAAVRSLWKEADGEKFFASQKTVLDAAGRALATRLGQSNAPAWLQAYCGVSGKVACRAIPGLLCGSMNYGCGVRLANWEELNPVLGCERFDEDGMPHFGEAAGPLFMHELAHSFANPLVDEHWTALRASAEGFFAESQSAMQAQAYSNPRITMYETVVRLLVLRWLSESNVQGAARQLLDDTERGFSWLRECVGALDAYERDRKTWPDLRAFMPRLAGVLSKEAERLAALSAAAPKLVRMEPANGATDVDPALEVLVLEFDRPMQAGSYSIVGSRQDAPGITGAPEQSADGKSFRFPVRFAANKPYSFSLNSPRFQGFRSSEGAPLKPIAVQFKTRG